MMIALMGCCVETRLESFFQILKFDSTRVLRSNDSTLLELQNMHVTRYISVQCDQLGEVFDSWSTSG